MGEVIQFPTNDIRQVAEIQKIMRKQLENGGNSELVIATVLDNMVEFLKIVNFDFKFTIDEQISKVTQDQFTNLSKALQHRSSQLILDRVKMELEHCRSIGIE